MSKENEGHFLKHFAIIGSGTILNMLLGLINAPLITRIVDPVEYGQLSIFNMYANIFVMVLCMGLDQALVRYYYEQEDQKYRQALLFKCIQLPVFVSCLAAALVIFLSASGIYVFEFSTTIMVFLCIYIVSQIVYRFSELVVRLEFQSKIYSASNVLLKLVYMLIAIPAVLIIRDHYFLLLVIATVGAELFCVAFTMNAQTKFWNVFRLDKSACGIETRELIRYAYPYIFSMGITTLFQAIDKISLNMFCDYATVGIYSSTMTLVNIFALVQSTFNTLWMPMAVEHYSKYPEDKAFHQRANQLITIVMSFLGISLILVKDLFVILLGEKYREAAYIFPFLIFNPIMYTISETTVTGLVFMKKSKLQVVVAAGACLVNLIGNTILVPYIGAKGAAISTGISYIVFFTLRTVLSNRYYKVDYKLPQFYFLTIIVTIYAFYNTFVEFNVFSVIGYVVCLAVLIGLYKTYVVWGLQYLWNMVKSLKRKKLK